MKFTYRESVDKEIANAVKNAKAEGKRITEVELSRAEYEELLSINPSAKEGSKFRGCLITVKKD